MSRTLNLVDILLHSGRHLRDIGRPLEAIEILTRLADFRQLPSHVVEEIQALLADLQLEMKDYTRARRHLTAALALRPLKGEYHYLMAIAIEEDDRADSKRAAMYYERAVEFEPDNGSYWADYGKYLLRQGDHKTGLKAVRKAYALGIHDANIVAHVAETLRREGRFQEATTKVRAAFFRNHGEERFRQLWQQHQFHLAREDQRQKQQAASGRKKGPVILPFASAEATGKYVELGNKTIRIDQAEPISAPKTPLPMPFRRRPRG